MCKFTPPNTYNTLIIGGGVAGIMALKNNLSRTSSSIALLESSNYLGGRLATEEHGDDIFDVGFQILLAGYPEVKSNLTISDDKFIKLKKSMRIVGKERTTIFNYPFDSYAKGTPREWFSKMTSLGLTIKDLIFLTKLFFHTTNVSLAELPDKSSKYWNISSSQYLKNLGASDKLIENFFIPFFRGVLLDNDLSTPAVMIRFLFKVFVYSSVYFPKYGITNLTKELLNEELIKKHVKLNSKVVSISKDQEIYTLTTENNKTYNAKCVINASNQQLLESSDSSNDWNSVTNCYFSISSEQNINDEQINILMTRGNDLARTDESLNPDTLLLIKNDDNSIKVTTTIVDSLEKFEQYSDSELLEKIKISIEKSWLPGIKIIPRKVFRIKKALPKLRINTKSNNSSFIECGDTFHGPSLQFAFLSGRIASIKNRIRNPD